MKFDEIITTPAKIQESAIALDAVLKNCWGFIDRNYHRTCRPSGRHEIQRAFYNGSKKCHGLNFQCLSNAAGMIVSVMGPMGGTQNDIFVLQNPGLLNKLDGINYPVDDGVNQNYYNVFGDKGYATRSYRITLPIEGNNISNEPKKFNQKIVENLELFDYEIKQLRRFVCKLKKIPWND